MKKFDITFKKFNKTKLPKKKIGSHFDLSTSATMEFEILAKSKWSHQHYPMKSACRNKNKAEFEMMRTVDIMLIPPPPPLNIFADKKGGGN